jgi:hypothetical protein
MDLSFLFVLVPVIAMVAGVIIWTKWRAEKILQEWAKQGGYRIIKAKRRWFDLGPRRRSVGYQIVYRVEVEDSQGHKRMGWVFCGSYGLGILVEKSTVYWDD